MHIADLHKAIYTAWSGQSLDRSFNANWTATQQSQFQTLRDTIGGPGQPLPYCVLVVDGIVSQIRMSNTLTEKYMVSGVPVEFHVYGKTSGNTSAKSQAAALALAIKAVFGGHPSTAPTDLELDHDQGVINTRLVNEFGVREDEDIYRWVLEYTFVMTSSFAIG